MSKSHGFAQDTLELLAKNVYGDQPKYKYVLYVTEGIPKNIDPWNASPNLDVLAACSFFY